MIDKKNYKLLIDITSNNKLDYNNFKSISDKTLNKDRKYYLSMNKFLNELTRYSLKNRKKHHIKECFTNDYTKSNEYTRYIDKKLNPIIEHFNNKELQLKKEIIYHKIIYGEIINTLDERIRFYENFTNDDRIIEPFIKKIGRAISGAARKVAKGVSDAARKAAEAARKAAEFIARKIREAVNKMKDAANAIKRQIQEKFAFLTRTLNKIKDIGKMILKIKDQILNTAREAINKVKNIEGNISRIVANVINKSSRQAKRNYKLAGEIKKAAIEDAQRELRNGIRLANRIAAARPKPKKPKPYVPDTSDFVDNPTQIDSDLNAVKKALSIDLPKRTYDFSPFYMITFIIFILILINKIYL